jgi:hypothetical protein
VKCDEAKPECNRCLVFGIGCDGYEKQASSLSSPRLPIFQDGASNCNLLLAPSPSEALRFECEAEQRHFQIFQSETATEICGIFESVFWQRLVLQGCHQERFILDAAIAISAYSTSLKLRKAGWQGEGCLTTAAAQAQFALKKYQNSLHVMRTSLGETPSPRKALMACLLVCTFEGLFGNTVTALTHARSGQTLVEDFLAEHPHPNSDEEGITSPAPHIIEDNLLQAASYFETQIVGLIDGRSLEDHARLKLEGNETIARMPRTFKDLHEACVYWDLVSRRSMHFVCEYSSESHRGLNLYAEYEARKPTGLADKLSDPLSSSNSQLDGERLAHYQCKRNEYLNDIARWSAAFSDLYSRLKRTTNQRQIMGAHTLYVKSRSMEMGVGSAIENGMCSHDKYFTHFREIATLSREIIRIKKILSKSEFAVELGIIPSLHMAAKWCRERTIRREAVALLQWYESREGHWDSKMMAEIDICMMELEEEGIDTEYIPECARARVLNITSDKEGGGWATVEYVRGSPRTGEQLGTKRIRCFVEGQVMLRRGSEEFPIVPYDSTDDGRKDDELCGSSCSTPLGCLFEQPTINK